YNTVNTYAATTAIWTLAMRSVEVEAQTPLIRNSAGIVAVLTDCSIARTPAALMRYATSEVSAKKKAATNIDNALHSQAMITLPVNVKSTIAEIMEMPADETAIHRSAVPLPQYRECPPTVRYVNLKTDNTAAPKAVAAYSGEVVSTSRI